MEGVTKCYNGWWLREKGHSLIKKKDLDEKVEFPYWVSDPYRAFSELDSELFHYHV